MTRDANHGGDVVLVDRESGRIRTVFERPRARGGRRRPRGLRASRGLRRRPKGRRLLRPGQVEMACVWDVRGGPPLVLRGHTRRSRPGLLGGWPVPAHGERGRHGRALGPRPGRRGRRPPRSLEALQRSQPITAARLSPTQPPSDRHGPLGPRPVRPGRPLGLAAAGPAAGPAAGRTLGPGPRLDLLARWPMGGGGRTGQVAPPLVARRPGPDAGPARSRASALRADQGPGRLVHRHHADDRQRWRRHDRPALVPGRRKTAAGPCSARWSPSPTHSRTTRERIGPIVRLPHEPGRLGGLHPRRPLRQLARGGPQGQLRPQSRGQAPRAVRRAIPQVPVDRRAPAGDTAQSPAYCRRRPW